MLNKRDFARPYVLSEHTLVLLVCVWLNRSVVSEYLVLHGIISSLYRYHESAFEHVIMIEKGKTYKKLGYIRPTKLMYRLMKQVYAKERVSVLFCLVREHKILWRLFTCASCKLYACLPKTR